MSIYGNLGNGIRIVPHDGKFTLEIQQIKSPQDRVWALIPAGGAGRRMQTDKPKQYLSVCEKPIIHHTLSRICSSPSIDGVVVGIADADCWWQSHSFSHADILGIYTAGAERMDTVENGLQYLLEHEDVAQHDWVLVHDAVRPCILQQDMENLVKEAIRNQYGAVLGGGLTDTLKRVDEKGRILETIPRSRLCRAYTPQIFRIRDLLDGIKRSRSRGLNVTDESMAMEQLGIQPVLVAGHAVAGIKVTLPVDLELVEILLQALPS